MADDIDDLLDEVEGRFCAPSGGKTSKTPQPSITTNSLPKRKDELSDIIDDIMGDDLLDEKLAGQCHPMNSNVRQDSIGKAVTSSLSGTGKCMQVFLGGSSCPQGQATAVNKRACSSLRCSECDFSVSTFEDFQWHSSTDYLFLRNNMPDFHRLESKLVPRRGQRAYACQCKWRNVASRELVDIQKESDLRWFCGRH